MHWTLSMIAAINNEYVIEKHARKEEEPRDYAPGNRPRGSAIPPARAMPADQRQGIIAGICSNWRVRGCVRSNDRVCPDHPEKQF